MEMEEIPGSTYVGPSDYLEYLGNIVSTSSKPSSCNNNAGSRSGSSKKNKKVSSLLLPNRYTSDLLEMARRNIIHLGSDVLELKHCGQTYTAGIKEDGTLECRGETHKSLSGLSFTLKQLGKPDIQSDNGWSSFTYKGVKLNTLRRQLSLAIAKGNKGNADADADDERLFFNKFARNHDEDRTIIAKDNQTPTQLALLHNVTVKGLLHLNQQIPRLTATSQLWKGTELFLPKAEDIPVIRIYQPRTAYRYFFLETNVGVANTQKDKIVRGRWNSLPDNKKQIYLDMAERDKRRWRQESEEVDVSGW